MREYITDLLDVLGLLLVAFGVAAALFPLIGWASAVPGGVVVLAGSQLAAWMGDPRTAPPRFRPVLARWGAGDGTAK